jgi:hypothetical protein
MKSLCSSCQHAHLFTRANGKVITQCCVNNTTTVPNDIVTCSDYHHADQPDRYELEKIAWILRSDIAGKIIGFKPPEKD